jgi:hypothetical protein
LFDADDRHRWLRERDGAVLLARLEDLANA